MMLFTRKPPAPLSKARKRQGIRPYSSAGSSGKYLTPKNRSIWAYMPLTLYLIRHRSHDTIPMFYRKWTLRTGPEDSSPSAVSKITHVLCNSLEVLFDQFACRLAEKNINLLQRLVFRLRHEQQLVEPANHGNTAIEAQCQTNTGHGFLHIAEKVGYEPRAEEECYVRSFHAVTSQICWVHFRRQDPGETGVGTEEPLVEDETGDIAALCATNVGFGVDQVAAANDQQAKEESGKHRACPEAATEAFHVEDCGKRPKKERATADERHEYGLLGVEAYFAHKSSHVVHDSVDPCELSEENHDVGVDDGTAGSRNGEEVKIDEFLAASGTFDFLQYTVLHDKEFFSVLLQFCASNTLPDVESFECFALVHEEPRRFGHEEHASKHDGRKDQR